MSNTRGRVAVDVQFTDSTTSSGVQSLKTITLQDATEYTSGKVAVVTGTCGTAAITVAISPSVYRNSAGSLVSFASVNRIVFRADNVTQCRVPGEDELLLSSDNQIAVTQVQGAGNFEVVRQGTAGTASFTLVIYGS